jgi:hypothetical protein
LYSPLSIESFKKDYAPLRLRFLLQNNIALLQLLKKELVVSDVCILTGVHLLVRNFPYGWFMYHLSVIEVFGRLCVRLARDELILLKILLTGKGAKSEL